MGAGSQSVRLAWRFAVATALVAAAGPARADEAAAPETARPGEPSSGVAEPPDDGAERAVREVTSPLPEKSQLAFKPAYTFPHGSNRYKAELQVEPILRYRGLLIPDLEVRGFWSIARLQLSALSQETSQGVASGLGDLTLTDLFAHAFGPLRVGLGYDTIFPMATNPALGQGKWQLGPALGLDLQAVRWLKLAVLAENFYSVAGSSQSPTLAYVTLQPLVTLHLGSGVFVSSDATMDFYWKGGKTTVPLDLGLGRAFSGRFAGAPQGWYWVAGDHQGDFRARAVLTFLR
jgi:hypothetical protein